MLNFDEKEYEKLKELSLLLNHWPDGEKKDMFGLTGRHDLVPKAVSDVVLVEQTDFKDFITKVKNEFPNGPVDKEKAKEFRLKHKVATKSLTTEKKNEYPVRAYNLIALREIF